MSSKKTAKIEVKSEVTMTEPQPEGIRGKDRDKNSSDNDSNEEIRSAASAVKK
jgi:hypothetical protein